MAKHFPSRATPKGTRGRHTSLTAAFRVRSALRQNDPTLNTRDPLRNPGIDKPCETFYSENDSACGTAIRVTSVGDSQHVTTICSPWSPMFTRFLERPPGPPWRSGVCALTPRDTEAKDPPRLSGTANKKHGICQAGSLRHPPATHSGGPAWTLTQPPQHKGSDPFRSQLLPPTASRSTGHVSLHVLFSKHVGNEEAASRLVKRYATTLHWGLEQAARQRASEHGLVGLC